MRVKAKEGQVHVLVLLGRALGSHSTPTVELGGFPLRGLVLKEAIEAQRDEATCLRPHSKEVTPE
jgi:hypothetical protein